MIVPHVEAGYHGSIPLALVEELLDVEVDEDPDSVGAILENGRTRAAERNRRSLTPREGGEPNE